MADVKRWRVVRVIKTYEPADDLTYEVYDHAAAAAFGHRTQHPGDEFVIDVVEDEEAWFGEWDGADVD